MTWGVTAQQMFEAGAARAERVFVWIAAKDANGDPVGVGFWNGRRSRTFDLGLGDGPRTYNRAGAALQVGDDHYQIGTKIMKRTIAMGLRQNAEAMIRQFRLSGAEVTIDQALFALPSMALIQARRKWTGFWDESSLRTPEIGGSAGIDITLASHALRGEKTMTGYKSHASQQLRGDDDFRRHNSAGLVADDVWAGPSDV